MENVSSTFSEIIALIRRNEGDVKNQRDVELDLKRLVLFARDAQQREELVQAQGVSRITLIFQGMTSTVMHRYCIA